MGANLQRLCRSIGSSDRQGRDWVKIYLEEGEVGLEPKKKPGNPLSRYERRICLRRGAKILMPTANTWRSRVTRRNGSIYRSGA